MMPYLNNSCDLNGKSLLTFQPPSFPPATPVLYFPLYICFIQFSVKPALFALHICVSNMAAPYSQLHSIQFTYQQIQFRKIISKIFPCEIHTYGFPVLDHIVKHKRHSINSSLCCQVAWAVDASRTLQIFLKHHDKPWHTWNHPSLLRRLLFSCLWSLPGNTKRNVLKSIKSLPVFALYGRNSLKGY